MAAISIPKQAGECPPRDDEPLETALPFTPRILKGAADRRVDRSYRFRFLAGDVAAVVALAALSVALRWDLAAAIVAVITVPLCLRAVGLFRGLPSARVLDDASRVTFATSGALLVSGAITGSSAAESLAQAALLAVLVGAGRAVTYRLERERAAARPRRIVFLGAGPAAQEFADRLQRHPEYAMTPLGFVDVVPRVVDQSLGLSLLGTPADLTRLTHQLDVDRIIVDTEVIPEEDLMRVLDGALTTGVQVAVLPALARSLSTAIEVEDVAGMTLLAYRLSEHRGLGWRAKRCIDVVLASVLLLLCLPVLAAAALAIKLDSAGPVVFTQHRVGRNGRLFRLFKLRSMVADAEARLSEVTRLNEADGPYFKAVGDPRTTRVGRLLRRTSIDELPQLVNVLRGEMSLVGPRPALPEEVAQYPDWFRRRLMVMPGLTGLWQVSGRFLLPFQEAARLDVFYVDHWSFGLDLKILCRTPAVVVSGRGAR